MDDLNFHDSDKAIRDEFLKIWNSKNLGDISNGKFSNKILIS